MSKKKKGSMVRKSVGRRTSHSSSSVHTSTPCLRISSGWKNVSDGLVAATCTDTSLYCGALAGAGSRRRNGNHQKEKGGGKKCGRGNEPSGEFARLLCYITLRSSSTMRGALMDATLPVVMRRTCVCPSRLLAAAVKCAVMGCVDVKLDPNAVGPRVVS